MNHATEISGLLGKPVIVSGTLSPSGSRIHLATEIQLESGRITRAIPEITE